MNSGVRAGRSSKGLLKRERILAESMRILASKGVVDLSYEILAQRLKLVRAHVKYYFDSKHDLLAACFLKIAEIAQGMTMATLKDRHDWEGRLLGVVDGAYAWVKQYPEHLPVLFLYYHYCAVNPKLGVLHAKTRLEGRMRLVQILMAHPKVRLKPSQAEQMALDLQIYLTGQIMEIASTNRLTDLNQFHRMAIQFAKSLIARIEQN